MNLVCLIRYSCQVTFEPAEPALAGELGAGLPAGSATAAGSALAAQLAGYGTEAIPVARGLPDVEWLPGLLVIHGLEGDCQFPRERVLWVRVRPDRNNNGGRR